ncbi:MAG: stage III sporulation protein AF [Lachnospiraceae bacterium]|nr:stage III sporulation protein AF [Lachnospiraceae bacterium]
MIEIIKEIGIFIVIAQSVLYFVPGQTYAKYVKVIIGIIMIAKMTQPVLTLITGDEWEKIMEQTAVICDTQEFDTADFFTENSRNTILLGIEGELESRLADAPLDGYEVRKVSVKTDEAGEVEKLIITVSRIGEKKEEIEIDKIVIGEREDAGQDVLQQENSRLREYYGEILAIPPGQIEIRINK